MIFIEEQVSWAFCNLSAWDSIGINNTAWSRPNGDTGETWRVVAFNVKRNETADPQESFSFWHGDTEEEAYTALDVIMSLIGEGRTIIRQDDITKRIEAKEVRKP